VGQATLESVEPILACPRCRSGLVREAGGGFRCRSESCALSRPGSFPDAGGQPVLVDFDDSVLDRADVGARAAAPLVSHRWGLDRLPRGLQRVWKPYNAVAARNVDLLLAEVGRPATVLVVGGGTRGNGVERIYSEERVHTIGFDVYRSALTQFLADAHRIPLADGTVDAVVVQAVLEHVLDPGRVVAEIRRVLRAGGLVYAETPFLQQVHAGAYDFTRFTSSGHRYLFRGFDEIASGPIAGPGTQMLWSVDHLVRGVARSELAGKLARALFFPLRYLDAVVPEAYAMDNAAAYFFVGRRGDRELTPQEIVSYYRGAQR
jgi:ubiquinone/menaquinone biosynthesis C-methylase UbiE